MQAQTPSAPVVTLLMVDDEPLMTELFRQHMNKHKFQTLTANSAIEALTLLEKEDVSVQMVITDMTMPEMNGLELAQALQERFPEIPVMIATGHDVDERSFHLLSNVKGFIQKPYHHRTLAERIKALLPPVV